MRSIKDIKALVLLVLFVSMDTSGLYGHLGFIPKYQDTQAYRTVTHIQAQNWDTQINFISDSTLTKDYLNETKQLRINGPLGTSVHSFRVILVPASGAVKAYGIDGDTITSPIRVQITAMEDLSQLIIDQTIISRYGKQEQLNPAYYNITLGTD